MVLCAHMFVKAKADFEKKIKFRTIFCSNTFISYRRFWERISVRLLCNMDSRHVLAQRTGVGKSFFGASENDVKSASHQKRLDHIPLYGLDQKYFFHAV